MEWSRVIKARFDADNLFLVHRETAPDTERIVAVLEGVTKTMTTTSMKILEVLGSQGTRITRLENRVVELSRQASIGLSHPASAVQSSPLAESESDEPKPPVNLHLERQGPGDAKKGPKKTTAKMTLVDLAVDAFSNNRGKMPSWIDSKAASRALKGLDYLKNMATSDEMKVLLPAFDVALGRLGKLDVGKATVVINDLHDLVVEHMASEYEPMGLDVPDKLEQLADGSRQALGCNAVDDYFKEKGKKPKQDVPSRLKLQNWRKSRVAAEAPAPAPVSAPDVTVIAAPAPAPQSGSLGGVEAKKARLMAKRRAKAPAPAPAAAESAPREKRAAVSRGSGRGALVVGTASVPVSPREERAKKRAKK